MTAREKARLAVGIGLSIVGLAILGWLISLLGPADGDESGIRVKNGGSVHVEADALDFEWAFPLHFKTTGTVNATAVLTVTGFDCGTGPVTIRGVTEVSLHTANRAYTIQIKGNRTHINVPWLSWAHAKKGEGPKDGPSPKGELSYGNKAFIVSRVTATGQDASGGNATLDCQAGEPTTDYFLEFDTR